MLILALLFLSLLIALARGGNLGALANLQVRHLWLFFVPLILQLLVFTPLVSLFGLGTNSTKVIYLASMLCAALALALNWKLPGLPWVAAGLGLNLLVITVNGGFMPVLPAAREFAGGGALDTRDNNVVPMTFDTKLWFLGDILPLPAWLPFTNVFSLGDVLIAFGGVLFIQNTLLAPSALSGHSSRA